MSELTSCESISCYRTVSKKKNSSKCYKFIDEKGLVNIICSKDGFKYKDSEIGEYFLSYFESEYYFKLCNNVDILAERFSDFTEAELNEFINNNIHMWKDETKTDILFRGEFID